MKGKQVLPTTTWLSAQTRVSKSKTMYYKLQSWELELGTSYQQSTLFSVSTSSLFLHLSPMTFLFAEYWHKLFLFLGTNVSAFHLDSPCYCLVSEGILNWLPVLLFYDTHLTFLLAVRCLPLLLNSGLSEDRIYLFFSSLLLFHWSMATVQLTVTRWMNSYFSSDPRTLILR